MEKKMDERNTIRGNWDRKCDFLLSAVGYCVGFGNVWRFPYLCYRNGGGAFLIPYFVMLTLVGVPLYFLELAVGQYGSLGPVAMWKLCPIFKGIALATLCVVSLVNIYYNILLAYTLFFLFASFTSVVPWSSCHNTWNTPACRDHTETGNITTFSQNITATNVSLPPPLENTEEMVTESVNTTRPTSPAEEFFVRYILDLSSGVDDLGEMRWQLALCFLLAWILVLLCLCKGIKSVSKVVYFTAIFPYFILVTLLIRGLLLPGSVDGLRFYIVPQWYRLKDPKVWGDAASQIFFSLGPAWGGLITFASFNKFHNNCQRDTWVASLACSGTSVFSGMVTFSILGFMAHDLGVPIDQVVSSGPGLAFTVYPAAIARMPLAPLWAILFFLMLLTVGLDSIFGTVEFVIVSICDASPRLAKRHFLVTLAVCTGFFLIGLPMATQAGFYIMALLDWYCATFSLIIIALLENAVIIYIYGYGRLARDIEVMLGYKPNIFFRACWSVITPLVVLLILIFNSLVHTSITYGDYTYPSVANHIGLLIAILPIAFIPGYMLFYYFSQMGSLKNVRESLRLPWRGDTWRTMSSPDVTWGPMMAKHRLEAGLEPLKREQEEAQEEESLKLKSDLA